MSALRRLPFSHTSRAAAAGLLTALLAVILCLRTAGPAGSAPGPVLQGTNVRVSTHDTISTDPYVGVAQRQPDVLQQNEPSIAVHPTDPSLIAVGMNDVRTLGVSNDAWQGLAVSSNGGASNPNEALIPGYPGDTSAAGLASPVHGNAAPVPTESQPQRRQPRGSPRRCTATPPAVTPGCRSTTSTTSSSPSSPSSAPRPAGPTSTRRIPTRSPLPATT